MEFSWVMISILQVNVSIFQHISLVKLVQSLIINVSWM